MKTKGRRIRTFADLVALSASGRAVVIPSFRGFVKPTPAAFVVNMQARMVHRMLGEGVYLYRSENEK